MPWMLLLHISSLLFWCGALLYLPALVVRLLKQETQIDKSLEKQIPRFLFTMVLTPAALIAIVSGTFVFLQLQIIAFWLILKLTLVCFLVICHALNGWIVVKMEKNGYPHLNKVCISVGITSAILMVLIFWLVLAKPF